MTRNPETHMKLGIVGLPLSGKTTVFNALTGAHGATGGYSNKPNVATVNVPDARADRLAQMFPPDSVRLAQIDYVDIPGISASDRRDQIVGALAAVREVDAILQVVRLFEDTAAPHPRGSLDPLRDVRELWEEMLIADMDIAEKRIDKLRKQVRKTTPTLEEDRRQLETIERLLDAFGQGKGVRDVDLTGEESFAIRAFQFLTEKPSLTVLNVGEDRLGSEEVAAIAAGLGQTPVVMSARLEMEISELEEGERREFMTEFGLTEPAPERLVRSCYERLRLRSFFTGIGLDFCVWTVSEGDNAWVAAGKIHGDIQRGFIRAEVMSYDDVIELGSEKAVRAAGRARLEGKEYVVQDGDIILFRFKV